MQQDSAKVDQYLAALPDEQRVALERLRATIRRAAPDATEGIAYQMPAFYSGKRFLVSYAAFKRHLSLFPGSAVMEEFADELKPFFTGKGTFHFTPAEPMPDELVERIVRVRLAELEG